MDPRTRKEMLAMVGREARKYFVDASGCHDFTHVERVRTLAKRIGRAEGADLFVVEVAALLHDISRAEEMRQGGGFCHAEHGAGEARIVLGRLGFDADFVDRVAHCIGTHRKRKGAAPESIEAKVLFDADKLDSIGAIGIGRAFLFAGRVGAALYSGKEAEHAKDPKRYEYTEDDTAVLEYEAQLKRIKDRLLTGAGRKIARERSAFMKAFFRQFAREVDGRE